MKKLFLCAFLFLSGLAAHAQPFVCGLSYNSTNSYLTISWCGINPNSQYNIEWSDDPVGFLNPSSIPSTIAGPWNLVGRVALIEDVIDDNNMMVTIVIVANQPHEFFRLSEFTPVLTP